ncbi:MAG: 50S ribosomal protein L25 [Candidatus Kapaibacteriota bacterium]
MLTVDLNCKSRIPGRETAKELRKKELVPCVFYAKGKENINFSVSAKELRPVVYTAHKPVVRLFVDGATEPLEAIVKDITFDPVTEKIVHIDFLGLLPNHPVTVELPVILKGTAIGTRMGGKLTQVVHKIKLTTTPDKLASAIEIDITKLDIGQQIQIKDIVQEGWKFSLPPSALICSVKQTRASEAK